MSCAIAVHDKWKAFLRPVSDAVWTALLLDNLPDISPRGADPAARSRAAASAAHLDPMASTSWHHWEKGAAERATIAGP